MLREEYARNYAFEARHWWYIGRRALVNGALKPLLSAGRTRALDIGCGTGYQMAWLAGRSRAYGVDLAAEALSYCRERGLETLARGQAERLPFADESFDVLVALDVLEHLPDDAAALREWQRVLVPGGHLVLFVPAYWFLWSGEDYVSQHLRRYRREELASKIGQAGFTACRLTYANAFLLPAMALTILLRRAFSQRSLYTSNLGWFPGWLNWLLARVFSLEAPLLNRFSAPAGSSLFCLARKPGPT